MKRYRFAECYHCVYYASLKEACILYGDHEYNYEVFSKDEESRIFTSCEDYRHRNSKVISSILRATRWGTITSRTTRLVTTIQKVLP